MTNSVGERRSSLVAFSLWWVRVYKQQLSIWACYGRTLSPRHVQHLLVRKIVVCIKTRRYLGSILASWVSYSTAYIPSTDAWRIPIWCQLITSDMIGIGIFFLPESPRWLMAKSRVEEATKVLAKYHGEGSCQGRYS